MSRQHGIKLQHSQMAGDHCSLMVDNDFMFSLEFEYFEPRAYYYSAGDL